MKGDNKGFGKACEQLAESFFIERGYKFIDKNFRIPIGEIDLVFEKDDWLVFVEVKARRSTRYGLPQEAVTPKKQRVIRRVAEAFLQAQKRTFKRVRFDVLAITFKRDGRPEIEHIPFAF